MQKVAVREYIVVGRWIWSLNTRIWDQFKESTQLRTNALLESWCKQELLVQC